MSDFRSPMSDVRFPKSDDRERTPNPALRAPNPEHGPANVSRYFTAMTSIWMNWPLYGWGAGGTPGTTMGRP